MSSRSITAAPAAAAARAGRVVRPGPARTTAAPSPAPALSELLTGAERWEQAARAGYDAGYAEGLRRAGEAAARRRDEIAAALDAGRTRLEALAAALERAVDEQRRASRAEAQMAVDALAAGAVELAEALVGRELAEGPPAVADALRRGLAAAPDEPAVVRVHPDDLAEAATAAAGRDVKVVPDPSMERGGCVIRAGAATVDARVSAALARVRAALGARG